MALLVLNVVPNSHNIEVTSLGADTNQIFEKDRRMFEYMMDNLITL